MTPMTARQVAAGYRVSIRTVHRMVVHGELVAQRMPFGPKGSYLFDPEHVAAAFAAREARKVAAADALGAPRPEAAA